VFDIDIYCMLTALGLAFMLSLLLTPLCRDLSARCGLVDAPDGRRKHQQRAVPRGGGLAVFIAGVGGVLSLTQFGFDFHEFIADQRLLSLFAAASVIVAVGLVDDYLGLCGRYKLVGQFLAVSVLIASGHLTIEQFSLFGWYLNLGPFGIILSYLWMIGIINAINLIDGMDGLLGVVGILVCLSLALVSAITGNSYVAIVSVSLAGALIGFLCFNLPPASVYLGDCGSMLIGLVVGALSIQGATKGPTAMALAVPISILILPILDTTAAITRRKLTGRSIYTTDRGHLHHCLLRSMNRPLVLGLVGVLGLIASAGAVATTLLRNDLYSITAVAIVAITLIATRLFGHAEYMLVREKIRALAALSWNGNRTGRSHQLEVRLQGSVRWQGIWEELTAAAFRYNFKTLCLDVNAPAMHEGYHARWDRFGARVSDEQSQDWRADVPICLNDRVIGRLTAVGLCDAEPIWSKLQQLAEIVRATEEHVHQLTERPGGPLVPAVLAKAIGVAG
jgi:UDP-GlcNAc:undecaprenyl-phosphate/decaprenyl-phosphate GlcNAc-1-phosphate transferase